MHLAVLGLRRWVSDAIEFRRLRRRLPSAHRAWSQATGKLRPETDAEYLAQLRTLARERERWDDPKGAAMTASTDRAPWRGVGAVLLGGLGRRVRLRWLAG